MTKRVYQLIFMALSLSDPPRMALAQAPFIAAEPASQIVLWGHAAAFEVQAGGAEPLLYQWRSNGTNISSATNASLRILADACTRAGLFQVTVSNGHGAVRSREVSLTVFAFLRTNAQPAEFRIWGPELTSYRVEAVSRLPAVELWQTVDAGAVPVNINTASAALLERLPSIDSALAHAIILSRSGPDGVEGTEDDTPFTNVMELSRVPGMTPATLAVVLPYSTTVEPPVLVLTDTASMGPLSELAAATETNPPSRFYRIVLQGDALPPP